MLPVGRLASGNSTLLGLLAGKERPVGGGRIVGSVGGGVGHRHRGFEGAPKGTAMEGVAPRPIVQDQKLDFDNALAVAEWIARVGIDAVRDCGVDVGRKRRIIDGGADEERGGESPPPQLGAHDRSMAGNNSTPSLLQTLADNVASLLTLTNEQLRSLPSEVRPSSQYLFGIACACMTSMAPCVADDPDGARWDGVRYPIILMDELFDTEHPSIVPAAWYIGDSQARALSMHHKQGDHVERWESLDE